MIRCSSLLLASVLILVACGTTSSSTSSRPQTRNLDAKEEGRKLTSAFYGGQASIVWARLTPEMKKAMGAESRLSALARQIDDQFGRETVILEERTREFWHPNGSAVPSQAYLRLARFSKSNQVLAVDWMFEPDGQVSSFAVKPVQ